MSGPTNASSLDGSEGGGKVRGVGRGKERLAGPSVLLHPKLASVGEARPGIGGLSLQEGAEKVAKPVLQSATESPRLISAGSKGGKEVKEGKEAGLQECREWFEIALKTILG